MLVRWSVFLTLLLSILFFPRIALAGDCYLPEYAKGESQELFLQSHCQPLSICELGAKESPSNTTCIKSTECAQKYPTKTGCMLVGVGAKAMSTPEAAAKGTTVTSTLKELTIPKLNVAIPGLSFDKTASLVDCDGMTKGCVAIPFLAQYINAFYKIILGIGLVATAMMIVWGGFLYVAGSTGFEVSEAKKKITDALIGLAILLGIYVIMVNINPQTVSPKTLNVRVVQGTEEAYLAMTDNTTNTTVLDTLSRVDYQPVPGEFECPMLMTKAGETNMEKFYNGVLASVKGGTYLERLQKVAEYAAGCNINLGDCGRVAMKIMALSGIGETTCLTDKKRWCWDSFSDVAKNTTQVRAWQGYLLTWGMYKGSVCTGYYNERPNRKDKKGDAIAEIKNLMGDNEQEQMVEALQPGDWVYTYTANEQCDGLHSSIFLGWSDTKGKGKTIEGDVKHNPYFREVCFKPKLCDWVPIIRIFRPNLDRLRP